jgi:hypothetical protein
MSERLHMDHSTRASQAVSRMNQEPGRKLDALRKRLLKLDARPNEMGMRQHYRTDPFLQIEHGMKDP